MALIEIECAAGLEAIVESELRRVVGRIGSPERTRPGEMRFDLRGDLRSLSDLRTVYTASQVWQFDIPRPKALLSNEHFLPLIAALKEAPISWARRQYRTLHLAAAGADSAVMVRLKESLATALGLSVDDESGDLHLRLKRTPDATGWEVSARLNPRPLVTRAWRVCNYPGALNAAVASALILIADPKPSDRVVNLGCGSGTFLIERHLQGQCDYLIGIDNDDEALLCSRENRAAANLARRITLIKSDMERVPLASQSADLLFTDLPFGNLSGSHRTNQALYPATLREARRLCSTDGRFVILTHEMRLLEATVREVGGWEIEWSSQIDLRGVHPKAYRLRAI